MLSHISITVFIFRDMSRDLAKSNFHINVLQGEGKLLPTDWQVDDGIPPPQPPALIQTPHSLLFLPSRLRFKDLLSEHYTPTFSRSWQICLHITSVEWKRRLSSPNLVICKNKKDRLHLICLIHYFYKLQDHLNMEYRTINLSHSPFMHAMFLFESLVLYLSELKVALKKLIPKLIQYYFKTTKILMLIAIKRYLFCYTHYLIFDSFQHFNLSSLSQILLGEVSGFYECCMHLKKYGNAFIILFYEIKLNRAPSVFQSATLK